MTRNGDTRQDLARAAVSLAFVAAVSLFITGASNSFAAWILPGQFRWLAFACVPSLLAALGIYFLIRPARPIGLPLASTPWLVVIRLSVAWLVIWLLASGAYAAFQGRWVAYTSGPARLFCFALVGPLVEELLFRGAVFELAERAFRRSAATPLLVSTALFSLYHLHLHHFHVTAFVAMQLAYTLPMGLVFGRLRALSGSIWPSFAVHVLTNLPHCFGAVSDRVV